MERKLSVAGEETGLGKGIGILHLGCGNSVSYLFTVLVYLSERGGREMVSMNCIMKGLLRRALKK